MGSTLELAGALREVGKYSEALEVAAAALRLRR